MNYFEIENKQTEENFNLKDLLDFQLKNDVQIIRGGDFQYSCYINKEVYYSALTPLNALVIGIKIYKENETRSKRR